MTVSTPGTDSGRVRGDKPVLDNPKKTQGVADHLEATYRPAYNSPSIVGSTIYVDTTGDDVTGDGTVGNPFATVTKAVQLIGTLNDTVVTVQLGAGSFVPPTVMSEFNWVTFVGTYSVSETRTISSVDTLSDADGIALTIDGGPFADDVLRGQLIQWTSGAASRDYGWIYRNTGNQIFVTNEDPTSMPAIVATDTIDFVTLESSLDWRDVPVIENCVQLNFQYLNMTDDAANGRFLFILSTDKPQFRYCFWDMAIIQTGGYGRSDIWCNYVATKGTGRGVLTGRNESFTEIRRGTVIDCELNTSAASSRFIQFSAGARLSYEGMIVIRGIEDARGIQCDGTQASATGGIGTHDTLRFETEGATPSCIAGFVINTTGEGTGGNMQLPNLHGEVTSTYAIKATGGAKVILGLASSLVTASVDNAVSATNGFSATAFGAGGTIIAGGNPFTSGFVGFNVFEETGNGILLGSFDQLNTGSIAILESNSPETGVRNLVEISNNNSLAIGAVALQITQNSTADGVVIDKNESGNALSIDADVSSISDLVGLLIDSDNSGTGASIAMQATTGHLVIGIPSTHVTDRAIHTFGTDNGIQLERVTGEEGVMRVVSGGITGGVFYLQSTGDMQLGETQTEVYIDRSSSQILIGDPFGDGADVHITVDNATGFITNGGSTTIGADSAPTATLQVVGDIAVDRTATAASANTAGETIVGVTDTTTPRTITLDTDDVVDGQIMIIKDESGGAGSNNITIDTEGTETIDGAASVVITVNYGVLRVYSDGTNWFSF